MLATKLGGDVRPAALPTGAVVLEGAVSPTCCDAIIAEMTPVRARIRRFSLLLSLCFSIALSLLLSLAVSLFLSRSFYVAA
jgi:hypothetical protein